MKWLLSDIISHCWASYIVGSEIYMESAAMLSLYALSRASIPPPVLSMCQQVYQPGLERTMALYLLICLPNPYHSSHITLGFVLCL